MIGSRLKLARAAAGISLRALESRVHGLVTAQAIGKYERNEMMPGSNVLLALARALEVTPAYLLSQRNIRLGAIEFRKSVGAGTKEENAVRARLLERIERYIVVEEILNAPSLYWQPPLESAQPVAQLEDGFAAAQRLRQKWHLGQDPIPSMTELLEEHGIKVITMSLPEKVFGSTVQSTLADDRMVPAVLINSLHTGERQRFTRLAASLGVRFRILACSAPPDVLRSRVERRVAQAGDASEANLAVLDAQCARYKPLGADEQALAIVIDTSRPYAVPGLGSAE